MKTEKFDVIVIGSGPAGEGAAMKCAKAGKSVAVVEKHSVIGGNCIHNGTIPSKVLRCSVQQLETFNSNPLFQNVADQLHIKYPDLIKRSETVIAKQVKMRREFYKRNHIRLLHGVACFQDEHTLKIEGNQGGQDLFTADNFIIATGSRPYHPPDIDFNHERILDSDTVLQLDKSPTSITIYGAGVIGCEYASIMKNLGIKTNLVNTRDRLLSFLDDEITDALSYHLRDQGVYVHHNETYEKVTAKEDGVIIYLGSGKKLKTDYLLWANGRSGNVTELNLPGIGIEPNSRQQIPVNEHYQTKLEHIYAVGDVIGYPSLASASFDQGRFAATHLVDGECHYQLKSIPTGIYTSPEISSIGKTERELTEEKTPYEIGHSAFRNLARSQIEGINVGMLKILFHRQTLEVLGVHCFGDQAAEIIHIGQLVMSQKKPHNNLMHFINNTFNYPTMAEAYRVAALNGLNRL